MFQRQSLNDILYTRDEFQLANHLANLAKEGIEPDEDTDYSQRRCTNIGEALRMLPGEPANKKMTVTWFQLFYIALDEDTQSWFPYGDLKNFENPSDISLANPLESPASIANLLACIRPSLLSSGIAAGRKSHLQTYEFYNPSVAARQLGFGQLPPKLVLLEKLKARKPVISDLHYDRLLNIPIPTSGDITAIVFKPSSSAVY